VIGLDFGFAGADDDDGMTIDVVDPVVAYLRQILLSADELPYLRPHLLHLEIEKGLRSEVLDGNVVGRLRWVRAQGEDVRDGRVVATDDVLIGGATVAGGYARLSGLLLCRHDPLPPYG